MAVVADDRVVAGAAVEVVVTGVAPDGIVAETAVPPVPRRVDASVVLLEQSGREPEMIDSFIAK